MEFTPNEAIMYFQQQKLDDSIQMFLRTETGDMPNPNVALADGGLLLENRKYFCPVRFPLNELQTV